MYLFITFEQTTKTLANYQIQIKQPLTNKYLWIFLSHIHAYFHCTNIYVGVSISFKQIIVNKAAIFLQGHQVMG